MTTPFKTSGFSMIKSLLTFSLVFITLGAFSGNGGNYSDTVTRYIQLNEDFKSVEISGAAEIILVNSADNKIKLTGTEKYVSRSSAKIKNNKLFLDLADNPWHTQTKLYLPVSLIETILINGEAHIVSDGLIDNKKLAIFLNGISNVEIRTAGSVTVNACNGFVLDNE